MENLVIEKTPQSPEVILHENGNFSIKGISNINHSQQFYEPVLSWIQQFKHKKPRQIKLNLELYYLNTSSALIMVELLNMVNSFKEQGTELNITWSYEEDDEDILDLGEDIQLTTRSDFEFRVIR